LTANQAGNSGYAAAPQVSVGFTVTAAAGGTSAANGKVLYNTVVSAPFSCAFCHGSNPAANQSSILKGTNYLSTQNAITNNKGSMGVLNGHFSTQDLKDIAAYLATPNI